jgi:serine/threonine protein kinase
MAQAVEVNAGGIRWRIQSEYRDQLLGRDGLRLDEWLSAGQAQVVKHGPHRTVYRVALPGLDVHVKHYRLMDLRAWLRELVRPAKAWLEYRRALAIAARQVPTVEPLAVGRLLCRSGPGDSFLITRSLDGTESLSRFLETTFQTLPPRQQTRLRQQLAIELARFVAHLYANGIFHRDLHAGNILVARDANGLRLFLIDLHDTKVGQPLSRRSRMANLIILNRYFSMRASRSDRLRFWRAYVGHGTMDSGLAKELERRTWASNLQFWRQRDGRCLLNNRYYQKIRSPIASGYAVRDLDPATIDLLLADPDAPFRQSSANLLKDSRSSTVVEWTVPFDGVSRPVIYKRFRATSWTDPFKSLLRPDGALRSWSNGHGLRERDLPTARPLAVLHRRRHGLSYDGYLLMEKIPNAVNLHAYMVSLETQPRGERQHRLRGCIDRVARLIRELHRRQLSHRDLKATNILVQLPEEDTEGSGSSLANSCWLIDLVGVRCHRRLPRRRRVQNLARLHASFCQNPGLTRTDKLRFLRTYQQWGLFGKSSWKRIWREIDAATQAKITRNLRNGRPLG